MPSNSDSYLVTPDGRYLIVKNRLWRKSNPNLSEQKRESLVAELISAQHDVGAPMKKSDAQSEKAARIKVNDAKHVLGARTILL